MKLKIKTSFLLFILTFSVQGFCCDCDPPCLGCAVCQGGICVASDYFCYYFSSICEECIMKSETEGECMCFKECCEDSDCTGECHNGCGADCKCIDDDTKCDSGETCCEGNCCEEGEICCDDGSCASPCHQSEHYLCTSSEYPKCVYCYMLPWKCDDDYKAIPSGNLQYTCGGGCPGDCHYVDDVLCRTNYKCANFIDYLAHCEFWAVGPEEEWEWICVADLLGFTCYECVQDALDPGEEDYGSSKKCN